MSNYSKESTEAKKTLRKILAQFRSGDSFSIEIFPGYVFSVDNKFQAVLKKKEKKKKKDKCKKCKKNQDKVKSN